LYHAVRFLIAEEVVEWRRAARVDDVPRGKDAVVSEAPKNRSFKAYDRVKVFE
jgi:hypothetical protein